MMMLVKSIDIVHRDIVVKEMNAFTRHSAAMIEKVNKEKNEHSNGSKGFVLCLRLSNENLSSPSIGKDRTKPTSPFGCL